MRTENNFSKKIYSKRNDLSERIPAFVIEAVIEERKKLISPVKVFEFDLQSEEK